MKYSILAFDLFKPPHRKPIQQQPFNNYSSILQMKVVSQTMKIRHFHHFSKHRNTQTVSKNLPTHVRQKMPSIFRKPDQTNGNLKSSWTRMKNSKRMLEQLLFSKTNDRGNIDR